MPRLSIVIVTFNSATEIDACLASLAVHATSVDVETVVVDNASSDGTAAAVRARWPGVRVLDAGRNLGFAGGSNLGIRQTAGELILLLNPDTVVRPGALEALMAALDARPDAAVAGPRLVDSDGRPELSFGRMISPFAELRQKLLVKGHDRGLPLVAEYVGRITNRPRDVDWVSGACLLVRRADAEAVGLLDERYFMYAEDVDFCAAIRARGRAVRLCAGEPGRAPARPIGGFQAASHGNGLPAQPAGLLCQASSWLGTGSPGLSEAPGPAARYDDRPLTPTHEHAQLRVALPDVRTSGASKIRVVPVRIHTLCGSARARSARRGTLARTGPAGVRARSWSACSSGWPSPPECSGT